MNNEKRSRTKRRYLSEQSIRLVHPGVVFTWTVFYRAAIDTMTQQHEEHVAAVSYLGNIYYRLIHLSMHTHVLTCIHIYTHIHIYKLWD